MKSQIHEHQNKNTIMSKNIIITILAIVFLSSCGDKKTENETEGKPTIENTTTLTDAQIKNAGIETGKIEQKEISSTLKLNGKIDVPPQNLVSISVPMGGYLKYTKLLEGMYITKGQVLCVVEDQQ
jgi:cobalt-zinc-cadmium efflux system membrane fusion protein